MKIFLKLLMALVVLAVIAPFYLKDKQGASLMSFSDLKMPNLSTPEIPASIKSAVSEMRSDGTKSEETGNSQGGSAIKIHKWKDEKGVWHFSSVDNSEKWEKSKVIVVNPGQNTFTATQPKKPEKEVARTNDIETVTPNILLPLTHGKATMDQAKQLQQLLEQRAKLQQQMMP